MEGTKITVVKEFTFDSAHYLPDYDGPCSALHGHTYKLQIGIKGPVIDGMVVDFVYLNRFIKNNLIDLVDHKYLNDLKFYTPHFPCEYPSAENMVIWIKSLLTKIIDILKEQSNKDIELNFIRLWETPTSYAEWVR